LFSGDFIAVCHTAKKKQMRRPWASLDAGLSTRKSVRVSGGACDASSDTECWEGWQRFPLDTHRPLSGTLPGEARRKSRKQKPRANKCGSGQPPKPHCYRGRSDCRLPPSRKIIVQPALRRVLLQRRSPEASASGLRFSASILLGRRILGGG